MNKLQELETKIRELCPELMELSFGCEVMANLCFEDARGEPIDDYNLDTFIISKHDIVEPRSSDLRVGQYVVHNQREYLVYKIIGHPITLEHVLKALWEDYLINGEGVFFQYLGGTGYGSLAWLPYHWKLGRPLEDQSEKTIKLLHKLICK
jgi:hypothetical protein